MTDATAGAGAMDAEDLAMFGESLRAAADGASGPALDKALADLGWREALDADRRAAVALLFEVLGATGATAAALDVVLAGVLRPEADGELAVVLPAATRWSPPGHLEGGTLVVDGVGGHAVAGNAVVLVAAQAGDEVVVVDVDVDRLSSRPVHGVDPTYDLVAVTGTVPGVEPGPAVAWDEAVARARVAISSQLLGASRRMLALACEHAMDRVQFGQPIAGFQAVRHRLAESLVATETIEAILDAAWRDGSTTTAAMAKGVAGREARVVSKHCQQVLAGIGFTTEHPLQLFVKRALLLDALFGTSAAVTAELGRELVRSRQLPPLLPL